jgi:CRISPR-associated Cas5-like protein
MKSVLIRLEGPIQSWGTQGRFSIRDTDTEPSKSGVIGFVAGALGMKRDDDAMLARLSALEMAVRIEREGALLHDYHTAGGGKFRGKDHSVWERYGYDRSILSLQRELPGRARGRGPRVGRADCREAEGSCVAVVPRTEVVCSFAGSVRRPEQRNPSRGPSA